MSLGLSLATRCARTGKEAICTSAPGRVEASRAIAKAGFACPLSTLVKNKNFLILMIVGSLLMVIVGCRTARYVDGSEIQRAEDGGGLGGSSIT